MAAANTTGQYLTGAHAVLIPSSKFHTAPARPEAASRRGAPLPELRMPKTMGTRPGGIADSIVQVSLWASRFRGLGWRIYTHTLGVTDKIPLTRQWEGRMMSLPVFPVASA